MAHLSGDRRGQLLLVTGLVLALVFIGLALVINSAIFTENLASRGEIAGSDGALSARAAVETNAEKAIERANYYNKSDSESETVDTFNRSLRNVSTQSEYVAATSGTLLNATYVGHRFGTRVNGTIDRSEDNYTIVEDVERVPGANGTRGYVVNSSNLPGESEPLVVKVNDTSFSGDRRSWRAQIWENRTEPPRRRTEQSIVRSAQCPRIELN